MLTVENKWKTTHPGTSLGIMAISNVTNPAGNRDLEEAKSQLTDALRTTFATKEDLLSSEPMCAYTNYYKQFRKTYHVLQQAESVIFKGKKIPSVSALVESMFMVELKNGLLTAGHDIESLRLPLTLSVSSGEERYIGINGKEQITKEDDMVLYDSAGIISTVLSGPDYRTRLTPTTTKSMFVVYAPHGITESAIGRHFDEMIRFIQLFAPKVVVDFRKIYS